MSNAPDPNVSTADLVPSSQAAVNRPRRRAGRPPRLTATAVVDAAVRYADAHGLESLSMPKLAKQLGVGTMTLYGYVASKRDLLDRMVARLFEEIRIAPATTWQEQMRAYFAHFRVAAVKHPALPALLSTVRIDLTPVAEDLEGVLALMQESGVTPKDSLRLFDAALVYTLGFVMRESPGSNTTVSPLDQWRSFVAVADPGTYEALSRATADDDGHGRFESGLDRLLSTADRAPD
jgi:AcrR family transcriptional regulator